MQGTTHGTMLAFGVIVAGAGQLALVWWAVLRAGFDLRPKRPVWTPELKRLSVIAAPAMLAGGVVQINLLIGRQVASFFDGAVAWLSYADRLYQLPLGVVGIAIGIVLLPDLSRRLQADDVPGSRAALSRATEMSLALAVPAAVALAVIPGSVDFRAVRARGLRSGGHSGHSAGLCRLWAGAACLRDAEGGAAALLRSRRYASAVQLRGGGDGHKCRCRHRNDGDVGLYRGSHRDHGGGLGNARASVAEGRAAWARQQRLEPSTGGRGFCGLSEPPH